MVLQCVTHVFFYKNPVGLLKNLYGWHLYGRFFFNSDLAQKWSV